MEKEKRASTSGSAGGWEGTGSPVSHAQGNAAPLMRRECILLRPENGHVTHDELYPSKIKGEARKGKVNKAF